MGLTTVTTGNTANAADLNQVINVLQRQSGQTEAGHYYLSGWSSAAGDIISVYVSSLSRVSSPVSVTIDTADGAAANINAPSTNHLTVGGFQVFSATTAATTNNAQCGGNYTIQY